jgi:hypothetical protein
VTPPGLKLDNEELTRRRVGVLSLLLDVEGFRAQEAMLVGLAGSCDPSDKARIVIPRVVIPRVVDRVANYSASIEKKPAYVT